MMREGENQVLHSSGGYQVNSVLLAENDREQCFFFKKALIQCRGRIQYTEVYDGTQLMKLLGNFMPDILFIDLSMPGKHGMDCIREIRENPAYDKLPIVVYSISSQPELINEAYKSGAQLFLVKPAEYYSLVHSLDKILSLDWTDLDKVRESYVRKDQYKAYSDL